MSAGHATGPERRRVECDGFSTRGPYEQGEAASHVSHHEDSAHRVFKQFLTPREAKTPCPKGTYATG